LLAFVDKFNADTAHAGLSATYRKGPFKTYERMKEDERGRSLVSSADTFEGRTTAASCLDLIRGTISVDTPKAALAVLDSFKKFDTADYRFKLVQVKNSFNEASVGMDGYRFLELNVLFKLGTTYGACGREGTSLMISIVGEQLSS